MIRIRHSKEPFEELELEGSNAELSALRAAILRLCEASESALGVPVDSEFDPSPYQERLNRLSVNKTTSALQVSVVGSGLSISGKPEFLRLFAENLPYDAQHTSSVPYHVHFDRIGREEQVSEASLPIVLGLRR